MLPALYQTFARYNIWMNERLYAACATLSDAERKRDRGAFFGSIHATLDHLHFADRAWMNRLAGRAYDIKGIAIPIFNDFDAMSEARRQLDADILAWTATLSEDWLAGDLRWTSGVDGRARIKPRWLLVSHMFNHQTHHRGQALTLLSQCGLDIGVTDLPWLDD